MKKQNLLMMPISIIMILVIALMSACTCAAPVPTPTLTPTPTSPLASLPTTTLTTTPTSTATPTPTAPPEGEIAGLPEVSNISPGFGDTGVSTNSAIYVFFTEAMNPATITTATFTLMQGETSVAGKVTYIGQSAIFTPGASLAPNTQYTAAVSAGAKNLEGVPLASNFVWQFRTLAVASGGGGGEGFDRTRPTVSSTLPVAGATDVAVNSALIATFSETIDPLTLTNITFNLKQGSTTVAGTVTHTGVTATFKPEAALAYNTLYTATITTGVLDLAGNSLAANKVWDFTTGEAPDATAPLVSSTFPTNGATSVAFNSAVTGIFSETLDPLTVTTATFNLKQGVSPVSGVVTYAGVTATFNPDTNLTGSTVYTATITTAVTDLAGNHLVVDKVWSFTTGAAPDTTVPTVASTIPAVDAIGVAINANATATFSEAMDHLTITNVTYSLKQGVTNIPGAVTYAGVTATFNPDTNLTGSTVYTATITTAVTDLAGNHLAVDKVWSFTTGAAPDITVPTVASTIPAVNAIGVAINANATATFSEAMDPLTLNTATFTLTQGVIPVTGAVTYAGVTAILTPVSDLARNTIYTATITSGAKDLAGNALATNYSWNFQTTANVAYYTINEDPSPVFSTLIPDQAYVIKDNINYKLYYAGSGFLSINLAQSLDGITWTPYTSNPIITDAQYHSNVKYYSAGFPGANNGTFPSVLTMNYRIWYQGLNGNSIAGWRYAESTDGINWYNHMPVTQIGPLVYSALTGVNYGIADVVYTPGAANTGTDWTFRIFANVQWEGAPYGGNELVVMAFSNNGYDWTGYDPTNAGYATPVFAGNLDGSSFDSDHIGWFKVIKNSPTDWQSFYSGGKGTTFQALNGIGYATSTDGINWTRQQTLFTTSDGMAWRSQSVWMPSVVQSGSNYEIYFIGSNNPDIGSSDWIQWKLGRSILTPDTNAPTVTSTSPVNAVTNVAVNNKITATFSEAMQPLDNVTFTLMKGVTPVSGAVTNSGVTATFIPATNLDISTVYTATITTGAKDLAGNALAANKIWSFTTGSALTSFESFNLGQVDGQDGWTSGHIGQGASSTAVFDVAVVSNTYGYTSFGTKSLRISNAITSSSFSDQTFSKSLVNDAGETGASTSTYSGGLRQPYFEAQWDIASTLPGSVQAGLSVTASPDEGDGARMSWLQMQDSSTGLMLNFYDYQNSVSDFVLTPIAAGLDRAVPHTLKINMQFMDGPANDIVKIYLDGSLIHTGTSWEDYARAAGGAPNPVDSIMFRVSGTAVPATLGQGFLIDNFSTYSGPIPN